MAWIIAIVVGAVIGYIASLIMHTHESFLLNIIIGIVGSVVGSWLFGNVLGFSGALSAGSLSLSGLFYGVLGAVVLLAILKAFRAIGS
jgi:uncharacterized membrane protein YeaQ/YmgE (transglycosylase-associated protein family)